MSKKICLHIGTRHFDVDAEDNFAIFLENEIAKDFNADGKNDIKKLFSAYVAKTYEIFTQNQKIEEILKKTEDK